LSLLLHDVTDIASSSLRELDAVALATNVTVFMERDTRLARHDGVMPGLILNGWKCTDKTL